MSQDPGLHMSLAFSPFPLSGAIVASKANGTTGPGGGEMGRGVPCLCLCPFNPYGCCLYSRIQETRALSFQECQGSDDMEKEIISDEEMGKALRGIGTDVRATS